MPLDQERLRLILENRHSYYGGREAILRTDARLNVFSGDILSPHYTPDLRVLDVGCGSGSTLLEYCTLYGQGAGIDNDPEHIEMAEEPKRRQGADNVSFHLMSFPGETEALGAESFDVIYSNLGPVGDSPAMIEAALHLLKPDGMLLCTEIGELHMPEATELFGSPSRGLQAVRVSERLRTWMAACGVEVRLCADIIAKWIYGDIYDWFLYQCNFWSWCGVPLPAADDPRLELFARRNANAAGEIVTTHHVAIVAGIKR